ncbi:MAG TPA: sigma-70 family RNA polymerase sigma factor [Planctomycetes bacterium]|nr:sigma-70 family RNA polymerase sigma factor [Planctomycetota bacterium]
MQDQSHEDWIQDALERFERRLCLFAARLLGDPERARDVVQDTFLELCRQPRERIEGHLAEWLFTVCRNRALDERAKENHMQQSTQTSASTPAGSDLDPARIAETKEESGRIARLVGRLPEPQREVLLLKFQQGLSYREIGSLTGHSVSNVGFLLHRAMKALRERMAGEIQLEEAEG